MELFLGISILKSFFFMLFHVHVLFFVAFFLIHIKMFHYFNTTFFNLLLVLRSEKSRLNKVYFTVVT